MSAQGRPITWTPTGRPCGVNPHGTDAAGACSTLIQYAERIQAR